MRKIDFGFHIENRYSQAEKQEIKDFVAGLEKRILDSREVFFDSADFPHERRQNDEVRLREKRGDREFDYKPAIAELVLKLAAIEPKKRREIMDFVLGNINYRITGVYICLNHGVGRENPVLFSDFVFDPTKYVS